MVVPLKLCYGNEKQQQVLGNNNNIISACVDGWISFATEATI